MLRCLLPLPLLLQSPPPSLRGWTGKASSSLSSSLESPPSPESSRPSSSELEVELELDPDDEDEDVDGSSNLSPVLRSGVSALARKDVLNTLLYLLPTSPSPFPFPFPFPSLS